jgi:F420 biosynthesis protein FbiB-like protein
MEDIEYFYRVIENRRTVRKFKDKPVEKEVLLRLIKAAIWAPSAHNAQPWHFIIIRSREVKERLAISMGEKFREDLLANGFSKQECEKRVKTSIRRMISAPVLIIACLTMRDMDKYPDERRQKAEYVMAVQSVAAAIQNLLLAAYVEGLGACWRCAPLFAKKIVRKVLNIPEDVEPQALIEVGYPDEQPLPPPRKPIEEILHWEGW